MKPEKETTEWLAIQIIKSFNWEQSVNLLNYAKIARTELVWIVSQRNINYSNNENNCKILSKLEMGNPGIYLKKNTDLAYKKILYFSVKLVDESPACNSCPWSWFELYWHEWIYCCTDVGAGIQTNGVKWWIIITCEIFLLKLHTEIK